MRAEPVFALLCRCLHQDTDILHSSPQELASACLESLSPHDRVKLKRFLTAALTERTDAELKGLLNRNAADVAFISKSARVFLQAALAQLESDG